MGIDDILNQGKKLYGENKEQVDGFLASDQAEQVSDRVFVCAADLAKKIAPDQYDATVDEFRDTAAGAVGNEK
jgi:hypothetical protein